jgi:mono/diheme cytochrome c family protein
MKRLFLVLSLVGCTGKYVRPTTQEKVPATPELIARGNYLVNSVSSCGACHTPRVGGTWLGGERTDAFLAGGALFDDKEMGFKIAAPNITQDKETGIGAWTDDEIMRAIRDGVKKDGELMWPPMPFSADAYGIMSDDDARAIVAYLRTVPPVKNKVDREKHLDMPFMAKVARRFGAMHHKPAKDLKAPPASDKKAYGAYLSRVGICVDCHSLTKTGPDSEDNLLGGSKVPLSEPEYGKVWARNLTPDMETGLGKFTADQIKEALKTGRRLDGKPMAPPMSLVIPHISTWTDEDLDALTTYLKTVPPIKNKVPDRQLTPDAKKLVGE